MRVHCILDRERYSTRIFKDERNMRTVVTVSIDNDELLDEIIDSSLDVEDLILVLGKGEKEVQDDGSRESPAPVEENVRYFRYSKQADSET